MPELVPPTAAVRDSFLDGEGAVCAEEGTSPLWLRAAAADFDSLVARRRAGRQVWGVPVTELWWVDGQSYLGTIMIRHELTAALECEGGNIGYHVVPAHRRRGHATAMLAAACVTCRERGMTKLLVTCDDDNAGSRRVIEANGGSLADVTAGIRRYWITL